MHVTGLSEGCFVSAPLEMTICIWNHYPTDLPSNVLVPLATWLCSVSHKSCSHDALSPGGFAWCSTVLLAA